MVYRNKLAVAASVLLLGMGLASSHADEKSDKKALWRQERISKLKYEDNIVYKTVAGEKLDMYLFLPKVKKYPLMPVMLFTHGGGWSGGDKYKIIDPPTYETLKILGENGIACADIEYRRVKRGKSSAFECVVDCKDAARFLVKNAAKYGFDPDRIGVWGDSAGGHLSLMTALGSNSAFPGDPALSATPFPRFRCVVSYYPLTSFVKPEIHQNDMFAKPNSFSHLIGGPLPDKQRMAELLSPAEQLRADSPPILLIHGDRDKILSLRNSLYMKEMAGKCGAALQLITVRNAAHGFSGKDIEPPLTEINRLAADFMIRHLTAGMKPMP